MKATLKSLKVIELDEAPKEDAGAICVTYNSGVEKLCNLEKGETTYFPQELKDDFITKVEVIT